MASLREIAKAAGLSVATVSRAMRKDPSVRPETIQRVEREAEQLGYHFNAYVGQMMSSLRRHQGSNFKGSIAWIWFDRSSESKFEETLRSAAENRAAELGYTLNAFNLFDYRPERLAQILKNRGIQGIIFSPAFETLGRTHLRFPVENFSCVVIGSGIARPLLHAVRLDHFESMQSALHHARHRFGKAIAAIDNEKIGRRVGHFPRSAFLSWHPAGPEVAGKLLLDDRSLDRKTISELFLQYHVNCLICYQPGSAPQWMEEFVPRENRIYLDAIPPGVPCLGWINRRYPLLGRWGVEMVTGLIQRNERGIPEIAQNLLISPEWKQRM